MSDVEKARIEAEGCLECGGAVHVHPLGEYVLCQDCSTAAGVKAYRSLFAIKAGYEDVPLKDNAPQ